MTPWETMTPLERNTALAKLLGYTVYHYDKDYASLCSYALMEPDGTPVVDPAYGRLVHAHVAESGAWTDAPSFVDDANAVRTIVEPLLESRGLTPRYIEQLVQHYFPTPFTSDHPHYFYHLTHQMLAQIVQAPPDVRCQAAVRVLQGAQQ